ncbi:RNA polymerase II transcriptional coactivator KIWI-like [Trifolium medium]|uniref:RNA polymerase II transcriptional coactivator KIWI-like n=1 Tax=Trifolium medium TaxID=97028 RepID=A0A392NB23_9FABA|nr:RNA polymerase II transcriptional coactivator KIWI-like [Trifolium medium]
MSRIERGKKREEHDSASDNDIEAHTPPKKSLKKDSDNNSDDDNRIFIFELSESKKVSVKVWEKNIRVDIRQFYTNEDGKQSPKVSY